MNVKNNTGGGGVNRLNTCNSSGTKLKLNYANFMNSFLNLFNFKVDKPDDSMGLNKIF